MVAQLLLSLSFLVAVHELGHLLAAKYFGMRVEQFSIGFPPKLWSFKKGETEYAISAIPLGGYVKISGMIDESLDTETMKQPAQPWEFRSKPAWQRLIVMLGGITVNVIVGILIFIGIIFVYGETHILMDEVNKNGGIRVGPVGEQIGLQTGDKIVAINGEPFRYFEDILNPGTLLSSDGYYTVERDGQQMDIKIPQDLITQFKSKVSPGQFATFRLPAIVGKVNEGAIADKVGLRKGDRLVSVNDVPVKYIDEVNTVVAEAVETSRDSISVSVVRAGETFTFFEKFKGDSAIGFYPDMEAFEASAIEVVNYGFLESIPRGTELAFTALGDQVRAFGKIITGKLPARESLSGPLGIMQAFGVEWNWERFWRLTGLLSLVLAFVNFLPIPALDGGHVMFLTYEMVSRRKPSDRFLETAQKIGMVFLLVLIVFIFANDIIKISSN